MKTQPRNCRRKRPVERRGGSGCAYLCTGSTTIGGRTVRPFPLPLRVAARPMPLFSVVRMG